MKMIKKIFNSVPEIAFICTGILLILSPHSRENSLYFPVILLTALFIIQLIARKDMLGFSLGIMTTLITLILIFGRFPSLWKLTHYTPLTTWIFVGHAFLLLTCLIMAIILSFKYFLSFRRKLIFKDSYPETGKLN